MRTNKNKPVLEKHRAPLLLAFLLCSRLASVAQASLRFGTMGAVESAATALDNETPTAPGVCTDTEVAQLEQSMSTVLDGSALNDFTLLLESADGRNYTHSKGVSSAGTLYESASTSKWVAAAVILSLVDRGDLTLDSKPQDFISWWTPASTNPAAGITLRHLMNFTSGLSNPTVPCMNLPLANFETCVQFLYNDNINNNIVPGTEFSYTNNSLQVAGLMAYKARGVSSWADVFDAFKSTTGLFGNSTFSLPSTTNPRLAGGMVWTGTDYMAFLEALYRGKILTPQSRALLLGDQRGTATVTFSPLMNQLNEDWHYALGNWVEGTGTSPFVPAGRNSSPGAYGAYPFIDFDKGYFGLVAHQDNNVGSFPDGVHLFRSVQPIADVWATKNCSQ